MKPLPNITYLCIIAIFVLIATNCKSNDSLSRFSSPPDYQSDLEEDHYLSFNIILSAKGHDFGYKGENSDWGGWYLDTICIGYDNILKCDSVNPSTLKFNLVTRELLVDLGDSAALEKIRAFMGPLEGFKRYRKQYEVCLATTITEDNYIDKYPGYFTFEADYPESNNVNADKINGFICELAEQSELEKLDIPEMTALYMGFNTPKNYRPVFIGNSRDMESLSAFLANKTFENWKNQKGDYGIGAHQMSLAIKPHVVNNRYVTLSKYEFECEGVSHGMFTETFHTFDIQSGKKLWNEDIFKKQTYYKVMEQLNKVMDKDPRLIERTREIMSMYGNDSRNNVGEVPDKEKYGDTKEPEDDINVELPDAALAETGVIFSYQPGEIDWWGSGAYHFLVPYENLMPYLTPKAKALIKRI